MNLDKLYKLYQEAAGVTTDTRKCGPGMLFFAIKGENFDGNSFAKEALKKGCIASVVTTLCNNGPAFAEFGPTKNFSHISTTSTIMLTAFMILGRLGFVYALVLFSRKLWKHY